MYMFVFVLRKQLKKIATKCRCVLIDADAQGRLALKKATPQTLWRVSFVLYV